MSSIASASRSTQTKSWPPELAAQIADALANRLFAELRKLNSPPEVFELLYGLEFFSLYQSGSHREAMNADFPAMLHASIQALMDTGGLR